jgi:hypothetical protein
MSQTIYQVHLPLDGWAREPRYHRSPVDLLIAPTAKAEIVNWTFHRILVKVPQSAATGSVFIKVHCGAESNKLNFTVRKKK